MNFVHLVSYKLFELFELFDCKFLVPAFTVSCNLGRVFFRTRQVDFIGAQTTVQWKEVCPLMNHHNTLLVLTQGLI